MIVKVGTGLLSAIGVWLVISYTVLIFVWSDEPDAVDITTIVSERTTALGQPSVVIGQATVGAAIYIAETILDKPGGFLANDYLTPGVTMDNMPSFEVAVIKQLRIAAQVLRNEHSRSQTQSLEDTDLVDAETLFSINTDAFMFPAAETEYRKAIVALKNYYRRLGDDDLVDAQFYARADNLTAYLEKVNVQLGGLSQKLGANIGQYRINTDLANDEAAEQTKISPDEVMAVNPWLKVDDVWWDARGTTWAILYMLKAAEIDFHSILVKKNALISLRQVIRELESTQAAFSSPMTLNGSGLGWQANYSLFIGKHIAVSNAAIIDLKDLLKNG